MKICSDCKYYGYYSETCVNKYNVLTQHKYDRDPVTGTWNSVDCYEFNKNGKCTRFEKPLLKTPIGFWIIALVLLVAFAVFLIGVSVGQHI